MSEGRALVQRTPNKASSSRSPSADARSLSRRDRSLLGESAAYPRSERSPAGFRGPAVDLATYDYYDLDAPRARAPGWSSLATAPPPSRQTPIAPVFPQAKLQVGAVDVPLEREADRVA